MANGLLLIDKSPGWTSHDVVAKCRGLLHERRIGHGGTLDPMATGLLVLFVGRATRAVPFLPGRKSYVAGLRFGMESDTQDSTGNVTQRYEHIPSVQELQAMLPRFTGDIYQIPPMYSAVKIKGERLYTLARKGLEAERQPRPVQIYSLRWLGETDGEHQIAVECSAGTYVRTLIHDLGHALGSGAVMTALRRTHSGPFAVEDACPVEDAGSAALLPLDSLFTDCEGVTIPEDALHTVRNGGGFAAPEGVASGVRLRCYHPDGRFWLLGEEKDGRIVTIKSFFEV